MKRIHLTALALLFATFGVDRTAWATPFTSGNILMVNATISSPNGNKIYEYTPAGAQIRAVDIPGGSPRSVVLDKNGNAEIYDGTFGARLTTYNPATGTFTFTSLPNFNTVNNVTYGGIAAFGPYVYLSNMQLNSGQPPGGVIRVNVDNSSVARIADGFDAINLNIGLDGKLYSLSRGGAINGGGTLVREYDPLTLQFIRSVSLPDEHRALAVDAAGNIYADGIERFTPAGVLIDSHAVGGNTSVRLTNTGKVLAGDWTGSFSLTDTTFASVSHFSLNPSQPIYGGVALVVAPVPEPSTLILLAIGGLALGGVAIRRRRSGRAP
jgi:hypothetical protein